jgi:hypothetical protein
MFTPIQAPDHSRHIDFGRGKMLYNHTTQKYSFSNRT